MHSSPVQLIGGLTVLSRCAIAREMVTAERVPKSHSIIRSPRRVWCPCSYVVGLLLFVES
jgi:hypothetical protein